MKKAIGLLAAVGVAGSLLLGTGVSAWPADCGSGRVCLYDYYDFVGQLGWRSAGNGISNISSANDNKMASWSNHTGTNAAWYDKVNANGGCWTMGAQSQNSALAIWERDTASSWKTDGGC